MGMMRLVLDMTRRATTHRRKYVAEYPFPDMIY